MYRIAMGFIYCFLCGTFLLSADIKTSLSHGGTANARSEEGTRNRLFSFAWWGMGKPARTDVRRPPCVRWQDRMRLAGTEAAEAGAAQIRIDAHRSEDRQAKQGAFQFVSEVSA